MLYMMAKFKGIEQEVQIPVEGVKLEGTLGVPENARALVIFAHGSGSSRHSPRNTYVASMLRDAGFATLLFDLLNEEEDQDYFKRFDIELLTLRLEAVTKWAERHPEAGTLNKGYFGASTGAAAAIRAAAHLGDKVKAVVSRGGRSDLADDLIGRVNSPTLFIVGEMDRIIWEQNESSMRRLNTEGEIFIIPEAGHLFEEPGALEQVAKRAIKWFEEHLKYVKSN
jgi:putative phosphoribosyl transferase